MHRGPIIVFPHKNIYRVGRITWCYVLDLIYTIILIWYRLRLSKRLSYLGFVTIQIIVCSSFLGLLLKDEQNGPACFVVVDGGVLKGHQLLR